MSICPAVVLGDSALSVDVQPAFCTEPCAVRMLVSVDPHEADRELIVEADSSRFYRSSLIQLDGDAEPAVHTLMWKGLPAGLYEIRATLKRVTGEVAQVATDVRVFGP